MLAAYAEEGVLQRMLTVAAYYCCSVCRGRRVTVAAYAEEGVLQRMLTVAAYAEARRGKHVAAYAEEGVLQRMLTVAAYAEERRPIEVHGLSLKRSPSPYAHVC
jgi:hypothetical protein